MELDDPWHWSIDRVVRELCTPDRSWQLPPATSIPELKELENILREQGVTGSILLLDIDDNALRNYFKFKTLSQSAFIRRAIEELRLQSAQYQIHVDRHNNRIRSLSLHTPALGGFYPSSAPPGPNSAFPYGEQYQIGQGTAPVVQTRLQSPKSLSYSPPAAYPSARLPQGDQRSLVAPEDRITHGELVIPDESGNKRRKLGLTDASNKLGDEDGDGPLLQDAQLTLSDIEQPSQMPAASDPVPVAELTTSQLPDSNNKKRKRIAPTLVSSDISPTRDRQIPTEADTVLHNNPDNIEPGVPFVTKDGKKRLVPIHQSSESEAPFNYDDLLQKQRLPEPQAVVKTSDQGVGANEGNRKRGGPLKPSSLPLPTSYLGKQKVTVDDLFYAGTTVGQELSASEESDGLSFCPKNLPSGRRLYVHNIMRRFLRSEPKMFKRDETLFYAVRPYASKLAPKFNSPSFTLFYVNNDGKVCSRREEVPRWPELDPNTSSQSTQTSDDNSRVNFDIGVLGEIGSYAETFDPECLVKYQYIQGGDEVLPIYGESDEENEYDIDTWAEIEEERGTLEKPLKPLKKPLLALEDINQAIDDGIAELVTKWQKEKLPKLQQKAFRLWKKFHKNREARRDHIKSVQKHLDRINDDRVPKLRKEILSEDWSSQNQVRKQTRVMEQSIYDRESSRWEINMLKCTVPPEKPIQKASVIASKSNLHAKDCEEGEPIGSESEASSSDEDMGDFIVEDTPSATEEIEMNFADTEDEDDTASDSCSPDSMNGSPGIGPTFKRPPMTYRGSDDAASDGLDDASKATSLVDTRRKDVAKPAPIAMTDHPIKDEPTLPDFLPALSNTADNPIDLTMLSSDDGPDIPTINLVTPKKPKVKLIHKRSPIGESPIAISDEEMLLPDMDNLPAYDDPDAIAAFSHEAWASISDRERLLISVVKKLDDDLKEAMFTFISSVTKDELWHHMLDVIGALLDQGSDLKGVDSATFQTLTGFVRLFHIYSNCQYHGPNRLSDTRLRKLFDRHAKWFPGFYLLCQKLEEYLSKSTSRPHCGTDDDVDSNDDDEEPVTRNRRIVNALSDDNTVEHDSQHRKRKRHIYENREARDMREKDRQRLEQQEERRKKLQKKLPSLEHAEGQHKIIINDGKYEDQGFVYVSKEIAPLIKQHQIEGVRFMWSQIVTDETDQAQMQGCLLAHTMGLGKTMQVITLLCAIAEASKSLDKSVSSQVPLSLQISKTMVLCPAGLINNWMDELLTWTPRGLLGDFRRVDSTMKLPERLQTINDWFYEGGVLLLGYEMFRSLYDNKRTAKREAPLSQEYHETVKAQLLDGPNMIVADEAHKMKNATSGIAQSTAQFRSKSRIALTGSPLANNVAEYHTMIDWVAPNYLGPAVEFRAKYVEPIEEGLWHDSTPADRRKSLKMLGVLKEDIGPKVHRADMSVLRNDLPPKKEFVITVPLTDLQKKVYTLYVQSMTSGTAHATTKDGDFSQTTILHWLANLSLLCNHPDCFNKKLNERKEDTRKGHCAPKSLPASLSGTDLEDDVATDLNTPSWFSQELVNKVTEIFREETNDLKAIDLSNKAKVLCQILDASKAAGDKVLVFSQSLNTLNFLEELCITQRRQYFRLDGSTPITKRQEATKAFNVDNTEIYLISTAAGGLGLNIFGANRVVIFDFKFNPIMEEQAVGRAYRIGQRKPVFVYRFVAGGTFEDGIHNKAVFKTQLASRVVDKKHPVAWARKRYGDMLYEPKEVEQKDLSEFMGMDPLVLDTILASQAETSTIRGIVQTDTFERDDDDKLTAEEEMEVKQLLDDEKLKRSDPKAFYELVQKRNMADLNRQTGVTGQIPGMHTNSFSAQTYNVLGIKPASQPALAETTALSAKSLGNRMPRAHPLFQPTTPERTSRPHLKTALPHRTGSTSPIHRQPMPYLPGDSETAPGTEKDPNPNRQKLMLKTLKDYQMKIGSLLVKSIMTPQGWPDSMSKPEFRQLLKKIMKELSEGAAEGAIKSETIFDASIAVLKGDKVKCQALATSALSAGDFARSIINSVTEKGSSSSGLLGNIEQSAMFKAMNRAPEPKFLQTPIAKLPTSEKSRQVSDDARQIQREFLGRLSQSTSPQKTMPVSNSSPKIPKWAQSEIREASRSQDKRRTSSRTTPTKD